MVEVRGIVVRYGATTALQGVDLQIRAREVHAVVGENGAGKSTLLRVMAGVVRPAAGAIEPCTGARIAWVPQEVLLPPDLTATDWIFLGCELRTRCGWLRQRAMHDAAAAVLRTLGCTASPVARLGALAVPQRKQVQLARALRAQPSILLLDEPTAVLGERETQALFTAVRALKEGGTGVLYVSHRLSEVLAIADRVTVLRDGCHISTDTVDVVDTTTLVRRMVGRDIPEHTGTGRTIGDAVLRLSDVATAHVRHLSFAVGGGEIVGLAGLVGAGRSEVLEAIAGLRPLRAGRVECNERPVFVPEDRATKGLIPTLGLRDNLFLPADTWLLRRRHERSEAAHWIRTVRLRTTGTEAAIDSLSGGNQQKLLLARALRHRPRLLLLDEPTAGVDVGVKAEIHALIRRLADTGTAVLLASSELPELLFLCDRIVALRAGESVGTLAVADASEARVAALITGS